MSVVIGIKTPTGIIMCSDTQQSHDTEKTLDCPKVFRVGSSGAMLGFTGHTAYKQHILTAIDEHMNWGHLNCDKEAMQWGQELMADIRKRCATLGPGEVQDGITVYRFEILVAVGRYLLYLHGGGYVHLVEDFKAIGCGSVAAGTAYEVMFNSNRQNLYIHHKDETAEELRAGLNADYQMYFDLAREAVRHAINVVVWCGGYPHALGTWFSNVPYVGDFDVQVVQP